MKPWQLKCVRENLDNRIKFTDCNVEFLAILNKHQLFLSDYDQAELKARPNSMEKNCYFYDIAKQRSGIYDELLMALFETKQSGAFSILMKGFIAGSSSGSLRNCVKSTQVQISHSWWDKSKYCSKTIETFNFSNSRLFTFLELLLNNQNNLVTNWSIQNVTTDFLNQWIHACVMGSHSNLLKIAEELGINEGVFESEDLLMLAVRYSNPPILDIIVKHYIKPSSVITLQNTKYVFRRDTSGHVVNYSVLNIAALRGNLPVLQALLEKTRFNEADMLNVIHLCVVDTKPDPVVELDERKQIIELILHKYPTLIKKKAANLEVTPLHFPNVHIDLIFHLINLGVDVNATNMDHRNILHLCPQYMSPKEYDKLIRCLCANGDYKILHIKDKFQFTPLHLAVIYLELFDSTLELFLSAKANFNSVSINEYTLLMDAVLFDRSERLLKSLIRAGADVGQQNTSKRTVLHLASCRGNLPALKYFIFLGCDVNAKANYNYTPLDLAVMVSKTHTHDIVLELLRNGANLNRSHRTLECALSRNRYGEVECRTIELLKAAGGMLN